MIRIALVAAVACALPFAGPAQGASDGVPAPVAGGAMAKEVRTALPRASTSPSRRADGRGIEANHRKAAHKAGGRRTQVAAAKSRGRQQKSAARTVDAAAASESRDVDGATLRRVYVDDRPPEDPVGRISASGEGDPKRPDSAPKFAIPVANYGTGRGQGRAAPGGRAIG